MGVSWARPPYLALGMGRAQEASWGGGDAGGSPAGSKLRPLPLGEHSAETFLSCVCVCVSVSVVRLSRPFPTHPVVGWGRPVVGWGQLLHGYEQPLTPHVGQLPCARLVLSFTSTLLDRRSQLFLGASFFFPATKLGLPLGGGGPLVVEEER